MTTEIPDRIQKTMKAFQKNRYDTSYFATKEEAAQYLASQIHGKKVGLGDSMTLEAMHMYELLSQDNTVISPPQRVKELPADTDPDEKTEVFLAAGREALATDIFMLSANAITETGIIVNMDGAGNRVAGSLFGHEKTYFVVSTKKLVATVEEAIARIHEVAAPQNAHRKGKRTPCAKEGLRCYDCASPARICNALIIHYKKMSYRPMEIVLVDEDLGL